MGRLNFIVTKQKLAEDENPYVVADSREYLTANFDFSSAWNECSKTAIFKSAEGKAYSVLLDSENSCTVPWEVIKYPSFSVSVYGLHEDERITTNSVSVRVLNSGYEDGKTPEDPTPTVYEQILGEINDIEEELDSLGTAAACDTGTAAGNIPILNNDGKLEVSTIPEEAFDAVQSNWSENDDTEISFIKNKPTNVSSFTNDACYLTTETDPTVPAWAKAATKPIYNYSEIENTPTIPEALTDLTGILPIAQGGTGAKTASAAISNLGAVPQTRTINSKALNSDIELTPEDVGAAAAEHTHAASEISSGALPIENGGTGATTYKDAQKNFHFYTDLVQLGITVPCTTADVVNALPTSSIFLLGTESVSASITDAPTGYGFFAIFKGANPNRKFGLFARSLTNTENYETGNWFYIMNVANGVYSWQKILTNVSTDNSLLTNSKTIVGAINEIYTKLKSSEAGPV